MPEVGLGEPDQRADQGRLAGPVRAEEAEGHAGRHCEIDSVDRGPVAEALGQPPRLDDRVHPPRLRVALDGHASGADDDGKERRRQQVADATGTAAVRHLEGGAERRAPGRSRVAGRRTRPCSRRSGPHRGGVTLRRRRSTRRTAATDGRRVPSGSRRAPPRRGPLPVSASRIASTSRAVRGSKKRARYGVWVGRSKRRGRGWIEDHRAARCDRRSVPPEPQREPEPEVGGADRVRALAWQPGRRRRDPDHQRVERLRQRDALQDGRPQQRLRVRDRRRAGVHGRRRLLAGEALEDPLSQPARRELERPAHARADHALDRLLIVRIPGERAHRPAAGSARARRR